MLTLTTKIKEIFNKSNQKTFSDPKGNYFENAWTNLDIPITLITHKLGIPNAGPGDLPTWWSSVWFQP